MPHLECISKAQYYQVLTDWQIMPSAEDFRLSQTVLTSPALVYVSEFVLYFYCLQKSECWASVVLSIGASTVKDHLYGLFGNLGVLLQLLAQLGSTTCPGPLLQSRVEWPCSAGKCWILAWKRVPSTELLVPLLTVLTGSVVFSSAHFMWYHHSIRQGDYSQNNNLKQKLTSQGAAE